IPDDFIEVERDLLLGLELDDIGDLLLLDRRQLDESGQTTLARDAHGNQIALDTVARKKLFQRLARELIGVRVGLVKDLGVFDIIKGSGGHLAVDQFEPQGFEGALAHVDSPHARLVRHSYLLPGAVKEKRGPAKRPTGVGRSYCCSGKEKPLKLLIY